MLKAKLDLAAAAAAMCVLAGGALAAGQDDGAENPGPNLTIEEAEKLLSNQDTAPDLFIGDDAPALYVCHWVQGKPVEKFKAGETYVIEMWATWCGPCIRAIPHLNELAKKYQSQDAEVTFVGMNVFDEQGDESKSDRIERIETFVENQEEMEYPVAIEQGERMSRAWMEAANQRGIPATFVVNGDGKIAWIGHPMRLDEPLERIVSGNWNLESARASALAEQGGGMQQLIDSAMEQLSSEETAEQGYRLLEALAVARFDGEPRFLAGLAQTIAASPNVAVRNLDWALDKARRAVEITNSADANILGVLAVTEFELGLNESAREHARRAIEVAGDDAGALNAIAWNMASNESIAGAAAPLALRAAKRAAEITERRDADILDTLARAQWEAGNHQQAIETQQEAIETATNSRMKQRYQETLASFRERAAG